MTFKRKVSWNEASKFVYKKLSDDIRVRNFAPLHLKILIEEIYPFSWYLYCKKHKLNTELKKDLRGKEKNANSK